MPCYIYILEKSCYTPEWGTFLAIIHTLLVRSKSRLVGRIDVFLYCMHYFFNVYFGKFLMTFIYIWEIGCMSISKCHWMVIGKSGQQTWSFAWCCLCGFVYYPTLAREFQRVRVWVKFVLRTLELTDTPTNLANQVKVGHALDQSRSVQMRGPERAHQNIAQSWWSSRTNRRLSTQFWKN